MQKTTRSPYFLALFASLGLALAPLGCGDKEAEDDAADDDTSTGDGDGDATTTGDGDGDGDPDPTTGDGDGDGDGDPDPTTGDGDGDECMGDIEVGGDCTSPCECASGNCYVIALLGGQCGECDEDADCDAGGCSPPNPFEPTGPLCNMGEAGGGCETSEVCQEGLTCGNVLSLLGVVEINTCGECEADADCDGTMICAPIVSVAEFSGLNQCIPPNTLEQDAYCNFQGEGDAACLSEICSPVDVMGLTEVGACGECFTDADCDPGMTCELGKITLDPGGLTGSTCI